MKSKKFLLIFTFLLFSVLISACAGGAYTSTSWHGLTAPKDTAYLSAGTQVYAIDVNTGTQKWRYPDKPNAKGYYANPVLISDGQLLVPSYDNKLYSLNPSTGSENWIFPPSKDVEGSGNRLISSPLVINDMIYQPSSDGYIYTLDMNGKKVWSRETGGPLWAQPASLPDCGCIFVTSMDHTVYSLNALTGEVLWQSPDLGGALVGTPAVSPEGVLYVGTFGNEILALDAKNGSILWRVSTDDWVWSGPVLENNILYYGDLSGNLYALNTSDHTSIWKLQLPNPILDKPVILEDKIYQTTEGDTLYIIDKTKGNIVDSRVIGGLIYSSPVISGDTILVAPTKIESILYGLNMDGNQKWTFTPAKK
jgi:eukaryotic-like serine/threonine-protein kinase